MNNIVIKYKLLVLSLIIFSCSSDNNPITEPQEESFTVQLIATNTSVNIDEVTTFEVKTNRPFSSITHSTDNFTTSRTGK